MSSIPSQSSLLALPSNNTSPSARQSHHVSPEHVVNPIRQRARPITKCARCRHRKSKCDSHDPCSQCLAAGVTCTYTAERSSVVSRRQTVPAVNDSMKAVYQKLETLQQLLAPTSILSNTPSAPWLGIDLEIDNLPTLLSKLWLKEHPEPSFERATHPIIVQVRQDAFPHWKASAEWSLWPITRTPRLTRITELSTALLPSREECTALTKLFISSCNWYFGLFDGAELAQASEHFSMLRESAIPPTSANGWLNLAVVLSICRLALALDGWAGVISSKELVQRRKEMIHGWCDMSVLALRHSGFEESPTLDGMKVLITLLSTLFFETDCGVLACSTEMVQLRQITLRCGSSMWLNRNFVTGDAQLDEERRKVWWSLVVVDSHFGSTGATDGVIPLRESDVPFPILRGFDTGIPTQPNGSTNTPSGLDLRSPVSRFTMGRFNNRCCELLARRKPFATVAEILQFDRDLLAAEASVREDHRIAFTADSIKNPRSLAGYRSPPDPDLWRGQQIFYVALWHIRSKLHRGLLFTAKASSPDVKDRINLRVHQDIVKDSSLLLLEFYRYLQLPTAFISAIVGAALTLCLQIAEGPTDPQSDRIKAHVQVVLNRLDGIRSPIIVRSRHVLKYVMSISNKEYNTTNAMFVPSIKGLQHENFQERIWTTPECLPTAETIRRSSDAARTLSRKEPSGDTSARSLGPSPITTSASMPQAQEPSNTRSGDLSFETSHDNPSFQVTHSNDPFKTSTKALNLNEISRAPLSTASDLSANPELVSLLRFGTSDLPSCQPFVTSSSSGDSKQDSIPGLSQADIDSILQVVEGDFHGSGAGVMSSQASAPLAPLAGFTDIQIQHSLNHSEVPTRESYPSLNTQPLTKGPLMSDQNTSISSNMFDPGTSPNFVGTSETAHKPDDAMDLQTFMSEFMNPNVLSELLQKGDVLGHESSSSITQPSSTSSEQMKHFLREPPLSQVAPSRIYNPDKSLSENQNEGRANFRELGDPAVSLTGALNDRAFFSHCIPLNHDQISTSNFLDTSNGYETQNPAVDLSFLTQPLNYKPSLASSNSAPQSDWNQLVPPDSINSSAHTSRHWIDDQATWTRSPNTNDNLSTLDVLDDFDQTYQGLLQHHGQSVDWGPVRS